MSVDSIIQATEKYNQAIEVWGKKIERYLKMNIIYLAQKGKGKLDSSLRLRLYKTFGETYRITYHFPRYGVFLQKGVGRGHVMSNKTVVRGVKNNRVIKLKAGSVNRDPKDWFNDTMNQESPKLADIIAEHKADEAALRVVQGIR